MDTKDTRPKAAVYCIVTSKRDNRAAQLLHAFCAVSGLRPTFYIDKRVPPSGQPPGWTQMCNDVASGQYDVVMVWQPVDGMDKWCDAQGVRYVEIEPFAFFNAMRAKRTVQQ